MVSQRRGEDGWQQASLAYRTPPSFALPWSSPGSPSTPSAPSESRGRLAWTARRQRRRRLCCSRRIYYCSGGASSLVESASAACAFSSRPPLSPRAGGGSCTTRAGSHAVDVDRNVESLLGSPNRLTWNRFFSRSRRGKHGGSLRDGAGGRRPRRGGPVGQHPRGAVEAPHECAYA